MFGDELEDLEVWEHNLSGHDQRYQLHVILSLSQDGNIQGGVACEYYPISSCGLVTYIVTNPNHRNKGVASRLLSAVLDCLPPLQALFLETNNPNKVDANLDIMSPSHRLQALHKLGFRILSLEYVQPPLGAGRSSCRDLYLCASTRVSGCTEGVSSVVLSSWLTEFYTVLCGNAVELNTMLSTSSIKEDMMVHYRTVA
jgi:GNAT superfamily N-acetyltransferase